jgi:hypothetical protein
VIEVDESTRIKKDIIMFEQNLQKLYSRGAGVSSEKIVELAVQYYQDAKYYLEKKDYFTSFGCINYGHGLLDALLNQSSEP